MGLADEVDGVGRERELESANVRLQQQLRRAKARETALIDAVYLAAKDAAVTVGKAAPIPRPARDRRRSPETALLHLTDWQLGKVTESFDTGRCQARVRETVRKAVRLAEIQRADHPVRACHVMLGGDLVENVTIFPTQAWEVDSTAFAQVFAAASLVEEVILSLLEGFETVTVSEVAGNHGRIGRKGDSPRADNLDRIVGKIARDKLLGQPRMTWKQNDNWYDVVEIGSYRALLVHGDQIKQWGGNFPGAGLMRKANSWAAGGIPVAFHDVYIGHLHQPMTLQLASGGLVRMCPSIESGSAYAREFMAALGRAGQRLVFVDPRRGRVTADYLLWLDDE